MVSGELIFIEQLIRGAHLAALAMCFVLVVTADLAAAKAAFRPLYTNDFRRLHRNHAALTAGMIVLWLTGAFLIWRGTGFDPAQFSPKLIAKIVVVTVLTLNAIIIGRVALPFFENNRFMTFGEHRFLVRFRLAFCGAVSSASWISAFCLGALPWLKTASAEQLISFLGPIYGVFTCAAMLFAVLSAARKAPRPSKPADMVFASSRNLSHTSVFPAE